MAANRAADPRLSKKRKANVRASAAA